jgi:hypothetical protein
MTADDGLLRDPTAPGLPESKRRAPTLGEDLKRTIREAALRAGAVGPQPAKDAAEITRQARLSASTRSLP